MNWDKINIKTVLAVLRDMEENRPVIAGEYSVIYSDEFEEVKISYKKLKEDNAENTKSEPVILDNNIESLRRYAEEYPENWKAMIESVNYTPKKA